jgi:hypothetical protein
MEFQQNNMRIGGLVLMLLVSMVAYAQPEQWHELKKKYPDESGIFLSRNKIITLEAKGDSLVATGTMDESILFLKDRLNTANDMRIFGSHFLGIENVRAKTKVWEKSKYKDIPITGLTRRREDDSDVFFDDSYFYHLSFPAAHAGNQAAVEYTEVYRDVRFLTPFYFKDYLPQLKGSLVLRVPQGVEINWQILNDQDSLIQFKKYTKGTFTHFEWTVENVPAYRWEDNGPKTSYYTPHVVFYVTSWTNKNGTKKFLSNLSDLHRWYTTTLQSVVENSTPTLEEIVKQLKQPGDREIDIVKKVFYWVQDNVRYVAFEDGMRGLVPHKASYVLEKRYGDCKDMASLIVGLLKTAGVKSYYTWIGTRDIPYRYTDFPSPIVDNHMIATYVDANNNYFFLDGTSNHTSFSLPSSMIQGKEAFIVLNDSTYEVKSVPEISSLKNAKVDTVHLSIDASTLVGKGKSYLTGYQKIDASYDFNQTQQNRQKENVVRWTKKGNNKFYLDSYTIRQIENKDLPLIVDYDFRVSDYVTYINAEAYVNLNLEKVFYNQFISNTRKIPRVNDYQFTMNSHFVLQIPEGYELVYLPPSIKNRNDLLSFDMSYQQSGSSIIFKCSLSHNTLLIKQDQFNRWNEAVKELSAAYKESIIFKKKTS